MTKSFPITLHQRNLIQNYYSIRQINTVNGRSLNKDLLAGVYSQKKKADGLRVGGGGVKKTLSIRGRRFEDETSRGDVSVHPLSAFRVIRSGTCSLIETLALFLSEKLHPIRPS